MSGEIVKVPSGQVLILEQILRVLSGKKLSAALLLQLLQELLSDFLLELLRLSYQEAWEWAEEDLGVFFGCAEVSFSPATRALRIEFAEIPARFYLRPGRNGSVPDATVLGSIAFYLQGGYLPETRLDFLRNMVLVPQGLRIAKAAIWVQVGAPIYTVTALRQLKEPVPYSV